MLDPWKMIFLVIMIIKKNFKSGDVILYSEVGLISTVPRLLGNCNYSRAGMVIRLPNKYTEKIKLYVIEITRNFDKFVDAYKEVPIEGLSIFRLYERIHQFPGESIHVLPLKEPLNNDPETNMIDWLISIHQKDITALESLCTEYKQNIWDYFNTFNISHKRKQDLLELSSTEFIIKSLIYGGRRLQYDEDLLIVPGDLVKMDTIFDEPIPLRVLNDNN